MSTAYIADSHSTPSISADESMFIELATRTPLPPSQSTFASSVAHGPNSPVGDSEARTNESALPPVDGGIAAWFFLFSAFIIEGAAWGFPTSYGVFLQAYLEDPQYASQKNAAILLPLVGNLMSGIIYCSGPFITPLCHRFPHRRQAMLLAGLMLSVTSLVGASYCTSIYGLLGLQGTLYAIGGSLLYLPTNSFLSEWFVKRRGIANGVIFAAHGIGGSVLPLIFPPLIAKYGIRLTLRVYSGVIAALIAPLLPFLRGRLPQTRARGPLLRNNGQTGFRKWMKNPAAWNIIGVNTVQGLAYFLPVIWLPTFGGDLHLSNTTSSLALALLNGSSVIGRVIMGYLADKHDPWLLALCQLVGTAIITFVLWGIFSYQIAGLLVFAIAYGSAGGSWSSLWAGFVRPIAQDDPNLTTNLFGYLLFTRGLGNILSTPISSILSSGDGDLYLGAGQHSGFEVSEGKYGRMIVYVGSCFVGAALFAAVAWWMEERLVTRGRR